MKVSKRRYAALLTTTVKTLLLGTLAIAVSISPAVLNEALADPLDKSSPKIAERTLQSHRNLILDEIEMALELGELEMADELLYELNTLERVGK